MELSIQNVFYSSYRRGRQSAYKISQKAGAKTLSVATERGREKGGRTIAEKFWVKWLKGDEVERLKLIEKLGIHKTAIALKHSSFVGTSFAVLLNSYLEDLVEIVRKKGAVG